VHTALPIAYAVVAVELVAIALVRKRFQRVSLRNSLVQVTLGGALVAFVGYVIGHG
jgi:VIT1/CCC1 family predicted Fe2+/Mn2+ transporter